MTEPIVYEASVYTRKISYKNFKGEEKTQELHFALDPLQLLGVMAGYTPKKIKSGNPALNGKEAEMSDDAQIKMIRNLAVASAGFPSEDGEAWEPFTDFDNSLVGKAFLTKLVSSDGDRREFSEKVIMGPFRAFAGYFMNDPSNSQTEINEMKAMMARIEKLFTVPERGSETPEEYKARLEAELKALQASVETPNA